MFTFGESVRGEIIDILEINMMKKLIILCGLALLMTTLPLVANDEFAPSWRGATGSAKIVFDFNDPNSFDTGVVDPTSPDFGLITEAGAHADMGFGSTACTAGLRSGAVVLPVTGRIGVTNLAAEGEQVIMRVQVTSTASELPFSGIESATGNFTLPEFVFCDGAEELQATPVGASGDLGDGYHTIAIEATLAAPGDCEQIQVFFEGFAEDTCIDEIIIDIQHSTNPGFSVVANVTPTSVDVVEEGTPANMVVSLDPNLGPVTGPIFVTLDPLSGLDIELDTVAAPRVLTFTNLNWETPQTVAVAGAADTNTETCIETFPFQASVSASNDSAFDGGAAQVELTINVTDLDSGCVFVQGVDTELDESVAGITGSLVYTLNRAPTNPVIVEVTDLDLAQPYFTADPNAVTFTNADWAAKTVNLSAVQDGEFRGAEPGTGALTGTSASSTVTGDATFVTNPDDVAISILEDECGALEFNPFDTDGDCFVGINELANFIAEWLACTEPGC